LFFPLRPKITQQNPTPFCFLLSLQIKLAEKSTPKLKNFLRISIESLNPIQIQLSPDRTSSSNFPHHTTTTILLHQSNSASLRYSLNCWCLITLVPDVFMCLKKRSRSSNLDLNGQINQDSQSALFFKLKRTLSDIDHFPSQQT
ncbi:hypothetical protein C5167_007556, partial [Papaver somniferum]